MKILVYGINYSPELTGIGKYTGEMCEWLAKRGHNVNVITALPYYPEWEIHSKYKNKFWFKENVNGVKVFRCPLYVPNNVTSIKRIIHEFSFVLSSLFFWIKFLFAPKVDVVICVSPPFHLGFLSLLYSKIRKVPIINHIQDLQVDAASDLNMIKNKRILAILFYLEKYTLTKYTKISSISKGMINKIISKGVSLDKLIFFPNWVDSSVVIPLPKDKSMLNELDYSIDDKIILYSGNLGEKQGLEIIIDVAFRFRDKKNIKFLIVGSGGGKQKLMDLSKQKGINNIKFLPLQEYSKVSSLLSTADFHLILQKAGASDLVLPSKLTTILSAGGCPIVSAVPGSSLYAIIEDNNLGFLIEPESSEALFSCLNDVVDLDISDYKHRARVFAEENLRIDNILMKFENDLDNIVNRY